MSTEETMRRDLGRKLQQDVGDVIARSVGVAQHVLPVGQLAIMLIEASVSMMLTTAATTAASIGDVPVDEAFDRTIEAIILMAKTERTRSLAEIEKRRAAA